MPRTTRSDIIQKSHDLFYRNGFHSVGLDLILTEVGVTKTTFYNHFESKDDLVAETLRFHDRWWRDEFTQMLRRHGGDKPREQLLGVFDALDALFATEEYNGCFFINVAVQFPNPCDPAHEIASKHKQAMEGIIRELAGYAGAEDPESFAQEFSLLMEGAYVTAQINRDAPTARVGRRLAEMLVERHIPSRT